MIQNKGCHLKQAISIQNVKNFVNEFQVNFEISIPNFRGDEGIVSATFSTVRVFPTVTTGARAGFRPVRQLTTVSARQGTEIIF